MKISRINSVLILLFVLLISSSSVQASSLNQAEYLIVQLATDKASYSTGDDIYLSGQVSFSSTGEPAAFATVCLGVLIESTRHEDCAIADEEGRVSAVIAYITVIPEGYSGLVYVEASALYEELEGGAQEPVEYGGSGGEDYDDDDYDDDDYDDDDYDDDPPTEQYLYLELWGPNAPVQIGGWEEIGIAGTVTSQGVNVDGALVTMKVAGQTFQTTTGTHTPGSFNWYWANNSFSAGDYWVEVTVTKDGYQSVTDSVPFTLIGADYDYWVTMDAIPTSLAPGNQVSFSGTLTLGGDPVSDWIEIYVTFPNGSTKGYSNLSDADGRFTHTEPSLTEIGTYQLVVHLHADDKQISEVYTFTVGIPSTLTPAPLPPPAPVLVCEIYAVYKPFVFVGEKLEVKGNVFCVGGDEEEPIFQEDWDVYVQGQAPYESSVMAPLVQTNSDGSFTALLPVDVFYIQELFILARDPEVGIRPARWFGPLRVGVNIEPEITFSQTDYDQGEFVKGELHINPSSFIRDWDDGVEIFYQISGPVDGITKQYLIESPYYSHTFVGGVKITTEGVNPFYWAIPHDAGAGKYVVTAYISGTNISTQTAEAEFYVTDIRHTNLTAVVEPAPDDWSSASLIGQYTDSDGVPIPNADVRVEFQFIEWNDEGTKIIGTREFKLAGTTDTFGNYEINLEPLDIFAGQGQDDPWLERICYTTVFADKEGYATGATDLQTKTPTASPRLEIISVDPPLDYLSGLAQSGLSYEELTDIDIKVQVRYNNIFGNAAKLSVSSEGFWATACGEDTDGWVTHNPYLSINGNRMLEWDVYNYDYYSARQNSSSWVIPGMHHVPFYSYPKHETTMLAQQGLAQESTISVSGKLFGYRYSENSPSQCGNQAYGSNSPLVPPPWVGARTAVHIRVGLGSSSAVANYNINPPSISAKGAAWVSPTGGEFKATLEVGNATGYALAKQEVNLSIVSGDIGGPNISAETENPTNEITIQASFITDENGELNLPLTSKTNPCILEKKAKYYVKISSSAFDEEKYIPIELHCVEELKFEFSEADISVVQVVDLTDNSPIQLVSGKEAGVRVYFFVNGEIYQPENKAVQFNVKFEMLTDGSNVPLFPQTKTVSLTEKGASVSGLGEVASFENNSSGDSGRELIYVDFIFTPHQFGGTETDFNIRITVDPDEVYGKYISAEKAVSVKKMKHLQILFVPVDVQNVDMSLILQQIRFLQETYPLGGGDIGWGIAQNYPSTDMPSKWTTSYLDQVCAALAKRYGSASGGAAQFRIVGLLHPNTWQAGWVDYYVSGVQQALGVHFTSSPQVVLVKHGSNQPNTLAHEIGHSYGLYLDGEQYANGNDGGNVTSGLVLRNGKIYKIPSDSSDVAHIKWLDAFGGSTNNAQKSIDSPRLQYDNPIKVYDLMGNSLGGAQQAWVEPDTYSHLFDRLKDPPEDKILLVQGLVNKNSDVFLEPVWRMTGLPDNTSAIGVYTLQLLSSNGDVLYQTMFGEKYTPSNVLPFYIQIPWLPGFDRIRILDGNVVKIEQLRSPNPPQFDSTPIALVDGDNSDISISWGATDADGDALLYNLGYQCNDASFWYPLGADLSGTNYAFDTSTLPGGESCVVRVMASDGFNTTETISVPFSVPSKVPVVHIFDEKTAYAAETEILLKGMAYDFEDGIVPNENLIWFSDIDGELGVGSAISVMLSPGIHHLILRAQDMDGNTAIAEWVFTVQPESSISLNTTNLLYTICGGVFLILLLGTVFAISVRRIQRQPKLQRPQQNFQGEGQKGTVQDHQGNWWYQDSDTGRWQIWDGQTWQIAPMEAAFRPAPPGQKYAAEPKGKGCLISIIVVGIMSALVIGGFSLVAFGFFPKLIIQPASIVSLYELLKIGGGGLLLTLVGTLLLRGGFKSIVTKRAIVEDEFGQRREKRGCSAILNGFGQVFFGLILLIAGLGFIALGLYQQLIPLLGYSLV